MMFFTKVRLARDNFNQRLSLAVPGAIPYAGNDNSFECRGMRLVTCGLHGIEL